MSLAALDEAIKAVCPIDGVARLANGVRIDFRPEATAQQRQQAQAVADGWDWSESAQAAREDARQPERTQLRAAAAQAVADNDAFLTLASPTNAQTLAQVRALTRQNSRIIKRLVQLD